MGFDYWKLGVIIMILPALIVMILAVFQLISSYKIMKKKYGFNMVFIYFSFLFSGLVWRIIYCISALVANSNPNSPESNFPIWYRYMIRDYDDIFLKCANVFFLNYILYLLRSRFISQRIKVYYILTIIITISFVIFAIMSFIDEAISLKYNYVNRKSYTICIIDTFLNIYISIIIIVIIVALICYIIKLRDFKETYKHVKLSIFLLITAYSIYALRVLVYTVLYLSNYGFHGKLPNPEAFSYFLLFLLDFFISFIFPHLSCIYYLKKDCENLKLVSSHINDNDDKIDECLASAIEEQLLATMTSENARIGILSNDFRYD